MIQCSIDSLHLYCILDKDAVKLGLIKDMIKGIWRESRSNTNNFEAFLDALKKDELAKSY